MLLFYAGKRRAFEKSNSRVRFERLNHRFAARVAAVEECQASDRFGEKKESDTRRIARE